MTVKCWLCSSFAARSLKAVIRHIGVVHARDSNFHVICGIQGCIRTYNNFTSFKKHAYRHHRELLDPPCPEAREISTIEDELPQESLEADEDGLDFLDPENASGYDHTEQAALFILKAKHVHKISQAALNDLLFDVSTMISDRVKYVENKVCGHFQSGSLPSGITEMFQHPAVVDPFGGLTTRYLHLKYYRQSFGLLVCVFNKIFMLLTIGYVIKYKPSTFSSRSDLQCTSN